MMKHGWLAVIICLSYNASLRAQTAVLPVLVTDSVTAEPLPGVTLHVPAFKRGVATGPDGFAQITGLPPGKARIELSCLGYPSVQRDVTLPLPPGDTLHIVLAPAGSDLEEVVVQSTRTGNRVENSPTKVEVLGRDDMDEENNLKPNNVASILGDYSGIQIQQTNLASGNATIRIQGLGGRYTQVLRDGLPLYAGLSGDFGILQIQPLDLQQIELIKGPASTFFGGGAIAGVVNFISKTPGVRPERAVTINQTTLDETNLTSWFSGKNKRLGYTLFAGATRATAKDVDGDSFTDVPRVRTATLHPRLFFYPQNGGQLAFGLTWTGESRRGGDLLAVRDQPDSLHMYVEKNTMRRTVADLQYRQPAKNGGEWTAKAAFSQFDRRRDIPGWTFEGEQQNWFSELAYRQTTAGGLSWVGGLNYAGDAFQKGRTDSLLFGDFQHHSAGLFGQLALHRGKTDAEAGLRLDARTAWGVFVLPAAAVLYHLTPALSLRAGGGLGYIAPNLLDAGDSDIDLRRQQPFPPATGAERSLGGNLEWNYNRLFGEQLSITWNQQFFYTRLNKPVIQNSQPDGTFSWSNADAPVTTTGVDHYLRVLYHDMELYLGYTFQNARQTWNTAQPQVPLTPRHRAAGVFSVALSEHFRTGLESAWTGRQTLDDGSKTKSYWFVAGMIGFHAGHFDVVVNGENLLDFRQTKHQQVVLPPLNNPTFRPLWAPVDGRVINLAVAWRV